VEYFIEAIDVKIADNDAPGVLIIESDGFTDVIEASLGIPVSFTHDTYTVALTKPPTDNVTIEIVAENTITHPTKPAIPQVFLPVTTLIFTPEDWNIPQTVDVYGRADNVVDGDFIHVFAPQQSLVQLIRGPLIVDGGDDLSGAQTIPDPLMLPHENETATTHASIFFANFEVYEDEQVDVLIIDNFDSYKDENLRITNDLFQGLGMGADVVLPNKTYYGGINYNNFERIKVSLGPGDNKISMENTSSVNLMEITTLEGKDEITINCTTGNVYVNLGKGDDVANVISSSNYNLKGLLLIDGEEGIDTINVNNSKEVKGNVLGVTRQMINLNTYLAGPNLIQALDINGNGGQYQLEFSALLGNYNPIFNYSSTNAEIEKALQDLLFPTKQCGSLSRSDCSQSFSVVRHNDVLFILFLGQLSPSDVTNVKLTSTLSNHVSEIASGINRDLMVRNSKINYYNAEFLNIDLSDFKDYINVQGTSAVTTIRANNGNDVAYISNNATVDKLSTEIPVLTGYLDYIEKNVNIHFGQGRHKFYVSDTDTLTPNLNVELTSTTLKGAAKGDITYTTQENFADGINIWLSELEDVVSVLSVFQGSDATTTVTTLHTGSGNDNITVSLNNNNGAFVLDAESGNII